MEKQRLKVISLFSGCGGMDLGFKLEGFNVIWANDINHWACETHRKNFQAEIIEGDVAKIDIETLPDCDVMIGGFPCQDFSCISSIWEVKQPGLNTDRGNLYKFYATAVRVKRPKVFVAENVKGILTANKGQAIKTIVSDFEKAGYRVASPAVYNFADYGVPQNRMRVLIVGIREDMPYDFIPPKPSHGIGRRYPYVTAGKALKDVEKVLYNNEKLRVSDKTVEMLKLIPEGGNFESVPEDSKYYVKGHVSHVYRRLDRNKPAYTLIAQGGGGTWGYHFEEPRPLTNRERARLQSFPDDFIFCGSTTEVRRQIGNAVPPEGIRPFAREIKLLFDGHQKKRQSKLSGFT